LRAKTGIKKIKVGHTGTLDPAATGLLILAVGNYTKNVPELIKQDKIYQVTMCLGKESSTGDKEGEISQVSATKPTKEQIELALANFTGEIMQTPPRFSAIKINGQRAYDLARKGQEVVLEPRKVKIYSNELAEYIYPIVKFSSHVGSGTYIRSLVADVGNYLGVGAYMSDLRRTQIGSYSIDNSVSLESLNTENIQNYFLS
jgi:tRNA pseudouridine55 synthase